MQISAHVSLCQDAMAVFNSRRLNDLAEVEQDMVMGETAEGDAPENIEGRVKTLLADPTITYAPARACDPDAGCAHTESVRERGGETNQAGR